MIQFGTDFNIMDRVDVKSACLTKLCKMKSLLGTDYTNLLDIGSSPVIKNWAGFIKMHLKHPYVKGMAFLWDFYAFAMELEGGEMVIWKVEKVHKLVTQARNLRLYLKRDSLRDTQAHSLFHTLVKENYYESKKITTLNMIFSITYYLGLHKTIPFYY